MLRITLHINAFRVADYEVRNVGPNTAGRCRYSVRPIIDDTRVGDAVLFVEHDRDDGAHALAATVLRALSDPRPGPLPPLAAAPPAAAPGIPGRAGTSPRDEWIEVGRDVMGRNDGWRWWHPRHLAMLLDAWEPLIRDEERARILAVLDGMWRDDATVYSHAARLVIADLRAAIEASDG